VASISRTTTSPVEDHYNIQPVINIYGGADGKDLGYVSDQIQKLVDAPTIMAERFGEDRFADAAHPFQRSQRNVASTPG
jgi:hypothetical protein